MFSGGRILTVVAAAGLAVAILYLSIPQSIAAFVQLPTDYLASWLRRERASEIEPEQLERLISSRQRAANWTRDGELFTTLAIAHLMAAGRDATAEDDPQHVRSRLLAEASASLRQGLAVAPVNPHAWAQLAYAELLAGTDPAKTIPFLNMSVYTGPYEPRLVFPRVKLMLELWYQLSPEQRELVFPQLRFAWNVSREKLVDLAMTLDKPRVNVVRLALARTPKYLASFERRLRWARIKAKRKKQEKEKEKGGS